jgi:peptidoglycan/LPS O-acetylase OafA/YrhL
MEERLHLKGLNGLRAIAAIGVVIAHIPRHGFKFNYLWPRWLGTYSVTIFFTLSGFLITYLLLTEKKQTEISIRNFYIRRILRIWPLYFAYLLIAVIIICIQAPGKLPGLLPYYLFFAANIPNILSTSLPFLGHYWSLGVEEQFYLFWPWLIKKPVNVFKVMVIFICIFFVLRLIARYLYLKYGYFIPINALNHTRFDCMAVGGIGAYLCFKKNKLFLLFTANKITELVCWLCLGLIAVNKYNITPFLNHDIVSLMALGIMVNLSFNDRCIISLENRFFDFLGRISYGIYVIHPLVLIGLKNLLDWVNMARAWDSFIFFFGAPLLTIGIAWLSYTLFEKRFLRLKDRFSVVKSSG